jgi:hypothetical protein
MAPRTQAQRQQLAAVGGSPNARKPPAVRLDSPSTIAKKKQKPQADDPVSEKSPIVQATIVEATANHGDPVTSGDPADVLNATAGDPAQNVVVNDDGEKSPIVQVHGSPSTGDVVVTEQRRSGRIKQTSSGKKARLEEEARQAADDRTGETNGSDDDDDYRTSPKQLPVIKKLKQGRTIKPFPPQGKVWY